MTTLVLLSLGGQVVQIMCHFFLCAVSKSDSKIYSYVTLKMM
jgi:hypothetical protein